MPIHLLWGDDSAARDRAVAALIEDAIDPNWSNINLSRLDGSEGREAYVVRIGHAEQPISATEICQWPAQE